MQSDVSPEQMTPQERFVEAAAILARGVLRLRACRHHSSHAASPPPGNPEILKNCLDLSGGASPHVRGG